MTERRVEVQQAGAMAPCPKCGNQVRFTIVSQRVAEDCCEVWARCECGFEHDGDYRLEDVWGGCHDDNARAALACWNETERDLRRAKNESSEEVPV